ncbi:MAG TPA: cbb3-type cytochrome c oxidase subunit I, partial [Solirubrobacterales bacterium]
PLFTWAAGISGYLLLVIGPVMLAALTMLFIDRHYGGVFFNAGEGGAPLLYEHLTWFFFTGFYVFVLVFASGVVSDVLPTFARKPLFSHRAAMVSMLAIAVLGPLAWMQNMYTAPIGFSFETFAMLFSLALTVPVGLLIFNWIATLWDGTLQMRAAPLFAIGAISALSVGLALELGYSVIAVGWQLDNTTAAQAATTAVFVGGMVLGGFSALHYWFPKLTGRTMGEGLGKASLGLTLLGLYVYVLMAFGAGVKAQPVDIYKFFGDAGVDGFNLVASIASFVLAIGILLELGNAAYSYRNGVRVGHDPWSGATLEWFTPSPPPEHNFDALPDVRSAEPLHDIRRAIEDRTASWRPPPPPEAPKQSASEPEPVEAAVEESGGEGPPDGASVA